ncbi:MAG: hypothetical protein JWM92_49 [Candidatus Nomurabacteria bacterium]|nr:hypothetical protein [Candidatus Nomurabacteria bacterium]
MKRVRFSLPKRHLLIGSCTHSFKKHYVESNRIPLAMTAAVFIVAGMIIIAARAYDHEQLKLQAFVLYSIGGLVALALLVLLYFAFSPACQKCFLEEVSENQEL